MSGSFTADIKQLPDLTPKSDPAMIELIRGLLDKAYKGKLTYLDYTIRLDGKIESVTFNKTAPYSPDK